MNERQQPMQNGESHSEGAAEQAAARQKQAEPRRKWPLLAGLLIVCIVIAAVWATGAKGRGATSRARNTAPPEAATQAKTELAAAPVHEPGEERTFDGIEFVWIPPGTFLMGSPEHEQAPADEKPQHRVTLTQGFWLGKYEVTKAQWKNVMGSEPWKGKQYIIDDPDSAAVVVTWDAAQEFARRLGSQYRLPTEAEWEYACRAGTTSAFYFGDDPSPIGEYAWYSKNARDGGEKYAHKVGMKKPNAWGLYDMHGNAWEWCQDFDASYPEGPVTDPTGPGNGLVRIIRGGSWSHGASKCRCANRNRYIPENAVSNHGLRVVRLAADA